MLLLEYLCNHEPEGIKSIILSSTLPASWMWGQEQMRMVRYLPQEMQDAIEKATASGDYSDPAYVEAEAEYMAPPCGGNAQGGCAGLSEASGQERIRGLYHRVGAQ